MAKTTPTINGVAIPATSINAKLVKYGTETRAANGTVYQTVLGSKWEWSMTCEARTVSEKIALTTIAQYNGTQTFVDEDGTSFTVLVTLDEPYAHDVEQDGADRAYDVTLNVKQV